MNVWIVYSNKTDPEREYTISVHKFMEVVKDGTSV